MIYKSNPSDKYKWTIEIDFVSDFKDIAYSEIQKRNHTPTSLDAAPLELFKLLKHDIPAISRSVKKSDCFICPYGYETALQEFENKVINGEDLWPFTTEKYDEDIDYNDLLLNDWNIFHFHLTRRYKPSGKAARNNWLIMAIVTQNTLYMIQVYDHSDSDCFHNIDLLEIINRNWPELLDDYRVVGTPNERLSIEQIGKLRESHINANIQLSDGTIVQSPGGGITTDGSSITAVMSEINMNHLLHDYQRFIVNNMSDIIDAYISVLNKLPLLEMKIILISVSGEGFACVEKNNGFKIEKTKRSFTLDC